MSVHKVRISGGPGTYSVLLDEHEIATALRRVTFDSGEPGPDLPKVTLDLSVWCPEIDSEAEVLIPGPTRDLLVRLGWTPPEVAQ